MNSYAQLISNILKIAIIIKIIIDIRINNIETLSSTNLTLFFRLIDLEVHDNGSSMGGFFIQGLKVTNVYILSYLLSQKPPLENFYIILTY